MWPAVIFHDPANLLADSCSTHNGYIRCFPICAIVSSQKKKKPISPGSPYIYTHLNPVFYLNNNIILIKIWSWKFCIQFILELYTIWNNTEYLKSGWKVYYMFLFWRHCNHTLFIKNVGQMWNLWGHNTVTYECTIYGQHCVPIISYWSTHDVVFRATVYLNHYMYRVFQ